MAEHRIALNWNKGDEPFTYEAYPRKHAISFKDGQETVILQCLARLQGRWQPRPIRKTCWWRRCPPATC